jgi:hypothetical protein
MPLERNDSIKSRIVSRALMLSRVNSSPLGLRACPYIARDHQVAGGEAIDNFIVCDIESRFYPEETDVARWLDRYIVIRDQGKRDPGAFGSAEQDFLDWIRAGVGINPDFHVDLGGVVALVSPYWMSFSVVSTMPR